MPNPTTDGRPRISVVIPVYNESATTGENLYRVQAVDFDKEILIVDDGSTDGARDFLAGLQGAAKRAPAVLKPAPDGRESRVGYIRVFLQDNNRGKGAALRKGFQESRGGTAIIQDADLECGPADYAQLFAPIETGKADVVYGSRFLRGPHRVLLFWHYVGNRFLTPLSDMITNMNLSDV